MKTAKQIATISNKAKAEKLAKLTKEFAEQLPKVLDEIEVAATKAAQREQDRCIYKMADPKYFPVLEKELAKNGYVAHKPIDGEIAIWFNG
ncbi:MAG: hypothetical protein H8D23_11130 [Candidatus Brocadiales bacterium]|nr:hypothetical protein [Candidatus Brocadiales bacterium]